MATFAKSSFSANNYYDMARQQRQFPQGKYILRSQKKSPDGQQYGIYLYYYWRGMHVRRSVDMYVAQKDWNQEANGGAGEFRSSYGPNYKVRNAYLKLPSNTVLISSSTYLFSRIVSNVICKSSANFSAFSGKTASVLINWSLLI